MNVPLSAAGEASELPRCITERGIVLTLGGALFVNGRAELHATSTGLEHLVAVAANSTAAGRQRNSRVEVIVHAALSRAVTPVILNAPVTVS
jgi:hypothetical protein